MKKLFTPTSRKLLNHYGLRRGESIWDAHEFEDIPKDFIESGVYITQKGFWSVKLENKRNQKISVSVSK